MATGHAGAKVEKGGEAIFEFIAGAGISFAFLAP
jgi:hypothetical protein